MFVLILAVLFVLFVVETIFTEVENFGWATVTLIASLVGFAVCGHFHVFGLPSLLDFVKEQGAWTLAYVGVYVAVGIAWSFVKWFSFLMGFRDAFREHRDAFLKSKGIATTSQVPENLMEEFKTYLRGQYWGSNPHRHMLLSLERPRASANKARITAWASFWPFSFVGTLLNDPVRRLFNFLFNQFKALYQRMADWVFRKDLELK